MEGLLPMMDEAGQADIFIHGQPMRITEARTYFRLKHLAAWYGLAPHADPCPISLYPWETWDRLGMRIEARLGIYLWHPSHWNAYYATLPDTPASTPGATPRTMADIRAQLREEKEEQEPQYALL